MEEILVVVSALAMLTLSVAGMSIYRRRMDVLTGPYIARNASPEKLSKPNT